MKWFPTRYPAIMVRHRMIGQRGDLKPCPAETGGRCRCEPSYRVRCRDENGKPKWSKVKRTIDEARTWQTDQRNGKTPEVIAARSGETFEALARRFEYGARAGHIASRSREPYATRTLDVYAANLGRHVFPTYGDRDATTLTVLDWQLLVDGLSRLGLKHNTLQTIMNAVRAIYRWACAPSRRLLSVNETRGVEMPAKDEVKRDRIASGAEARQLISALKEPTDRLEFGLALYAGLRNMERWGLDWSDIDLGSYGERGSERSPSQVAAGENPLSLGSDGESSSDDSQGREMTPEWGAKNEAPVRAYSVRPRADHKGSTIRIRREITKSKAGVRSLPVIAMLRPILMREWLRQGKPSKGPIVRGPNGGEPSNAYCKMMPRVSKAWEANGLERITPHSCRHTFASYLIASGLNAKAVSVLMGHATIQETFDRYGHMFKGHEDEAGDRLDAYLGVPDADREMEAVGV